MTDSAIALPGAKAKFAWMFSQKIDLISFFLPALIAPLLFMLGQCNLAAKSVLWAYVFLNAFGLGDFHVGITWFNYFDRNNWHFYMSSTAKRLIYLLAPPAIVIFSIIGLFFAPALVLLLFIAWSIQHLVQQNVGLLLLYHNFGRNEAIVNRVLEIKSLQVTAIFFSLLFAQRILFPSLGQYAIWQAIVAVIGLATIALIICYLRALFLQVNRGAYLNIPAFLFWCLSIYFFVPFAFLGKSYFDAILITNIMHWAQYIGIMYVLVQRKYRSEQVNNLPWHYPILLFLLIGLSMTALLSVSRGILTPYAESSGYIWVTKCLLGLVIGLSMVHYLQDAFMWRFREPYYKTTVLSYLRSST